VARTVDLNADVGESAGGLSATDRELVPLLTSASIACGVHAGDTASMQATLAHAARAGVCVGAHPGLADREGFGRRVRDVTPDEVEALVALQVDALAGLAAREGAVLRHVKAHGALYTMAARDEGVARAVVAGVASADRALRVFAPAGSALARAAGEAGLRVVREAFADRGYEADGSLTPRGRPGAALEDPAVVARRVVAMVNEGAVATAGNGRVALVFDTLCIHGDTPGAAAIARAVRDALEAAGIVVAPPG
jgi:UPF0271 protein